MVNTVVVALVIALNTTIKNKKSILLSWKDQNNTKMSL